MAGLLALAVCACASGPKKIEENVYPTDYRTQIVDLLRKQLDNPKGIREAFVAEPVLKTSTATPRYIACVRFNAPDTSGSYRGSKDMVAYFYAGQITQVVDATRELCGNAAFQPFPEL